MDKETADEFIKVWEELVKLRKENVKLLKLIKNHESNVDEYIRK